MMSMFDLDEAKKLANAGQKVRNLNWGDGYYLQWYRQTWASNYEWFVFSPQNKPFCELRFCILDENWKLLPEQTVELDDIEA